MAGDDDTLSVGYEVRRQARGGEPAAQRKSWRRRLLWATLGLLCLTVASLVMFFQWSWSRVTTVHANVRASVVPLGSHVDARLLELDVRPGQAVTQGQKLARLDDSELKALMAAAEAERDLKTSLHRKAVAAARLAQDRVQAGIDLARARVSVAEAQLDSTETALEWGKSRTAAEIRRAEALYEQARSYLERLEKGPRHEEIEAARARVIAAKAMAELSALEVQQSEQLVGEGIDSEHLLAVKKAQLITQQSKVREAELELARLTAGATAEELEEGRQALAARKAELELARAGRMEIESLAAELRMRQGEVQQARAELAHAEALRAEVTIAQEQIEAAEAELEKARAGVDERQAALRGMLIVSTVTGTVIQTCTRVGEIYRKGEPLVLVADDSAGRWVEGYIQEKDAARVHAGQPARIEIILGSGDYVDGKVEAVGLATSSVTPADSRASAGTPTRWASQLVWVKLQLLEHRPEWRPGMTARVVIRVR